MEFHHCYREHHFNAAADETLQRAPTGEFLSWLADRLVKVYGESPNMDFVRSLRARSTALQNALLGE